MATVPCLACNADMPGYVKMGWYTVYFSGPTENACVDLVALVNALPHGSGIDSDWHVEVAQNGNVRCCNSYHAMDDNGMYCGYRDFSFRLFRYTRDEKHPLRGPCAGQVQVTYRKGDIGMSMRGSSDLHEYLYETCEAALSEAGIVSPMRQEIEAA